MESGEKVKILIVFGMGFPIPSAFSGRLQISVSYTDEFSILKMRELVSNADTNW